MRPWKNVDTTVGFHKDLLALTAGLEGLGEARTAAVARLADDYINVAPRKVFVETLLRGDLPESRRTELTAARKGLTEFQDLADDAVAAIYQATTAKQVRAVKLPVVPVIQPKAEELVQAGKWARFLYSYGKVGEIGGYAIGGVEFGVYPLIRVLHPELIEALTLSHNASVGKACGHEPQFGYHLPQAGAITIQPKAGGGGEVGAGRLFKSAMKHRGAFDSSGGQFGVRVKSAVEGVAKTWRDAKTVKLHIRVKGFREPITIDVTPATLGWEDEVRDGERD